jgi:very-short-patch-repair endonuclease
MSKKYPILDDYDWLYTAYIKEERSAIEIGEIVGCSDVTVAYSLKKKAISLRSRAEVRSLTRVQNHPLLDDYAFLYQKYRVERVPCRELALVIGCDAKTILNALRRLNIPVYTLRESKTGKNMWSEERKKAQSGKNHQNYGKPLSEETKKKISCSLKKIFEDPEKAKARFKAITKRPTKPEKQCCEIFRKNELPYKYVGDGGVVIGNKCPDFIHFNKKIVIEVFGRAFHSPLFTFKKSMPYHQTYDGTMKHYKRHGYKCVIIWDRDLEREDAEEFVLTLLKKAGII